MAIHQLKYLSTSTAISLLKGLSAVSPYLLALDFVVNPNSTACSADQKFQYMTADGTGYKCEPKYEISAAVLKFLDLTQEEQIAAVKENPALCDYYSKLKQVLLPAIKFSNLSCSFGRETNAHGTVGPRRKKIAVNYSIGENKYVTSLDFFRDDYESDFYVSDGKVNSFESDESKGPMYKRCIPSCTNLTVKNDQASVNSKDQAEVLFKLKRFVPLAVMCCQSDHNDEEIQQQCRSYFFHESSVQTPTSKGGVR